MNVVFIPLFNLKMVSIIKPLSGDETSVISNQRGGWQLEGG